MKQCSKCKTEKDPTDFWKHKNSKDGLNSVCKDCSKFKVREWIFRNKEKSSSLNLGWKKRNPEKVKLYSSAYENRKRKNMPKWVNKIQINQFYKDKPYGYEVDHIIPLKGKNVTGLHVIHNLQYLSSTENKKKYNNLQESVG